MEGVEEEEEEVVVVDLQTKQQQIPVVEQTETPLRREEEEEVVLGAPRQTGTGSWVKKKLPLAPTSGGREVARLTALSRRHSAVGDLKSRWQGWESAHSHTQKLNPFSAGFDAQYSMSLRLQPGEEGYGRPKEGTKTAERAQRAERHIHGEIDDLCHVIRRMSREGDEADGRSCVTFGALFERYVRVSDKVVGILLRARKHGKVAFDGEMLWQGQDDAVVITLLV
ncbi:unnamed protein product [Arctogadus glacialis]